MDITEKLRTLEKAVLRGNHREAFDLHEDAAPHLTREQRIQILTGWNEFLRTRNDAAIIDEIRTVCRQLNSSSV